MNILVVDDYPANRKLMRAVLEAEGFKTVEAADGVEALAALDRERIDAVVSDVLMPRMDGYRLCYEVRHSERHKAVPLIFCTSTYTSPADEKLGLELGADRFITKPAAPKTIARAIRAVLTETRPQAHEQAGGSADLAVMREYSEVLVKKLEDKNTELQSLSNRLSQTNRRLRGQTAELERARQELRISNEELEHRVRERTKELESAIRELGALCYSMSHDLRAPLRHILSFATMLEESADSALDEASHGYLANILKSSLRAAELTDDLLNFFRLGRAEMRTGPVNLAELVKMALRDLEAETKGRNILWKINPLPEVRGDCSLLRQVLVNLISNAVKYTRTRARAEIEIASGSDAREIQVVVRDNGVGFDARYAGNLFGVFQRLHSVEEFDGTGIGLANVRRIIERHGGRTWAEGAVDHGAAFYFSLPQRCETPTP